MPRPTSNPDPCRLVPVSYVIFRRGDFVLLQLRRGTGYMDGHWGTAAAGHVEAGESAIDGAVREASEELGVAIERSRLVPLTVMHRGQEGAHPGPGRVDFFFVCTSWSGDPLIMEHDKAADLRWFHLDRLPSAVVPHERYVIERLMAGMPPIITFGFAGAAGEDQIPAITGAPPG